MYDNGVISHVNDTAHKISVNPGMTVHDAAHRMVEWIRPIPDIYRPIEIAYQSSRGRIMAMGSVTFIKPENEGDVICTGPHFGMTSAAYSSRFHLRGVICSDAGRCRDDSGIAGLEVCQRKGIAGGAVSVETARIGEGMSTYADGIFSAVNDAASALSIEVGMPARQAALLMLERDVY